MMAAAKLGKAPSTPVAKLAYIGVAGLVGGGAATLANTANIMIQKSLENTSLKPSIILWVLLKVLAQVPAEVPVEEISLLWN